jgi:hypothetical protein
MQSILALPAPNRTVYCGEPPNQLRKKQLLDGVETLFRDGRRREHEEGQALQAELYEKIGRLNMEIEWLKKRVARCG